MMKIEKLVLKNFRQYQNIELSFEDKDLYVIIGKMGTGKSNFLNSINWCLYGEEPFLSGNSEGLPILNLKSIDESEEGDLQTVSVELWIKNDNRRLIFSRNAEYIVHKDEGIAPAPMNKPEIEVKFSDGSDGYITAFQEDAEEYVERFVPSGIREYFFFDGERLNTYFKQTSQQKIKNATYQISQTRLVGTVVERLSTIINELEKEAGKNNPQIESTRQYLEKKNAAIKAKNIDIQNCEEQIKKAQEKVDEYTIKLNGIPEIDTLKGQLNNNKSQKKMKEEIYNKRIEAKQNILFEYSKLIMAYPAIKESILAIEEKKKKNELPPTGDVALIESILHNSKKCICGTRIIEGSEQENRLKEILENIEITSEVGKELQKIESPLIEMKDKIKDFEITIRKATEEVKNALSDIEYFQKEIEKIDLVIGGFDDKLVSEWYQILRDNRELRDKNRENLGVLKNDMKELKQEADILQEKLSNELEKDKKSKNLKRQIDFAQKSMKIADECKNEIMDKIREEITTETSNKFLELHWKSETFDNVYINEDFEFEVNHAMGYPCLGTLSGGERCVLALAFTMALHKVSGFDSPILIDRPLAMASGEAMSHIADILTKLSKEKQIVLLLTPEDNKNVDIYWNSASSYSKYTLQMESGEMNTNLEEL